MIVVREQSIFSGKIRIIDQYQTLHDARTD